MKTLIKLAMLTTLGAFTFGIQAAEPLVDVEWVKENIGQPNIVFLDVRGRLSGKSKADYLEAHIPGAVHTAYLK